MGKHSVNELSPAVEAAVVDLALIPPVQCPCGQARRALAQQSGGEMSLHEVEVHDDAVPHYHRRQTETYYILECGPDAAMELNGERVPLQPGMCVFIPPLTRHRAVGRMRILNIVRPAFDPADEFFD